MTDSRIVFRALGTPELRTREAELHSILARPKLLGLLSFLAAASPRGVHRRDTLLGLFWAETDQQRARRALRQSLYYLRQSLGPGVLVGRGEEALGLDEQRLWCDVTAFEAALGEGRSEDALELYRGDLLDGFYVSGASEYERWLDERREELRRRASAAAWELAERAGAEKNAAAAGHWAHRAAALEPFDEHLVRQAIELLDRMGDRAGAVLLYEAFAHRLAEELELEPAPETQVLVAAIRERTEASGEGLGVAAAEAAAGTAAAPALETAEASHHSVPEIADTSVRSGRTERPTAPRSMRRNSTRRRMGLGLAAVAALGLVIVWLTGRGSEGARLDPQLVAVAVFENQTGEPDLDPLGRMAADWITQALHESGVVDVVPSTIGLSPRPDFAAREPSGAAALAEATGAGTIVVGAYYRRGDSVEIGAQVIDAADGDLLSAVPAVRSPLVASGMAVDSLSRSVARSLAVLSDPNLAASGDVSRPPSLESYRHYLEGFRAFQRTAPAHEYEGGQREALAHFYQAVELDSTFLAPRFYMVMAHSNVNEYALADSNAQVLAGMRHRLSETQRHTLDWMLARLRGDETGALEAARARGGADVGVQALRVNRPAEAVEVLSTEDLSPRYFHWLALMEAYHLLGDYQRELDEARRGRDAYPGRLHLLDAELRALAAAGRVEEVGQVLDESLSMPSVGEFSLAILMANAVAELRTHGQRAASAEVADRAIEWLSTRPAEEAGGRAHRFALALAYYQAERWEEARALLGELASENPHDLDVRGYLGAVAARLDDRAAALAISDSLSGMAAPPNFGGDLYRQARIASVLGDRERAIGLLRAAVAAGFAYGIWVHRDVDLEPLRGDPAFEEFLRPKA